jgi:phospholipase D1/2
MTMSDNKEGSSFGDKLKAPFEKLKDKLEGTHLHDAKVKLIHTK